MANAESSESTTHRQMVRQLQDRQQRLLELSSDWYWEQDDQYCFTTIIAPTVEATAAVQGYIGKTFWNIGAFAVANANNWDSFRARLHAREPFVNFLTRYSATATDHRYVSISGRPSFSGGGQFSGYYGLAKDISGAVRDEQLLKLQNSMTCQLAEATGVTAGLQIALQNIGHSEGWDCAACWSLDHSNLMLQNPLVWQAASASSAATEHLAQLLATANDTANWIDQLRLNTPLWIANTAAITALTAAPANGLHTVFIIPINAANKIIGLLLFASAAQRKQDALLLQASGIIGHQIGLFLQRQRAEQTLRDSEARFRSLTEFSSDWYWEQDDQFRFVDVAGKDLDTDSNFVGKTHWDPFFRTEPIGMSWDEHRARVMARQPFRDLILKGTLRDGSFIYYALSGRPFLDDDGNFKGYRGVGRDITEQRHSEERIRYLASHDALTKLPNRAMFSELLNLAISYAHRYKHNFAVMFIDLDRFKLINDTLGHDAGDDLLKEISARLTATLRASDVVARLGGDEFVVLVQEINEPEQAAVVARKILSATTKPLQILGQECRVTASIGISLYPVDAQDELTLMKNADIAMYQAKEAGKNNYQFYSLRAREQSLERLALEASLRRALERSEFELHYQAKLDLRSDQITGVEALLRWQHPDLGSIPPAQFIPLAEETGLIVPIGRWVIRTACAQNMAWQREGLPPVCIAVNLSARQFADDDLLKDITDALQESGLSGELLELELTESMVMQDYERTIKTLTAIKAMNVRVAIDDFGVGYSSLAQIKNFPIDTLKVDRSFIRDLPQNSEDSAITKAIIAMGKTLSLRVVAEGVETIEQENFLRANACDETQGFYFSRPITPDKFAELLHRHIAVPKT